MNKKVIVLIIVIIIFSCTSIVFSSEIDEDDEKIKGLEEKVNIVNQKVEDLEKYNNNILDNTKWIFGLSITIILFILGGFGIFSVKITDRDLKIIKEELKQEHSNRINEFEKIMNDKFHDEINLIQNEINNTIDRKISYKVSALEEKIRVIKVDLLQLENKISDKKSLPMYNYRRIVENAAGIFEREYIIADILKKIDDYLDTKIDLDTFDEEELVILLKKVPDRFETQKVRILNKLKGIST